MFYIGFSGAFLYTRRNLHRKSYPLCHNVTLLRLDVTNLQAITRSKPLKMPSKFMLKRTRRSERNGEV
ncbi:hypothetical protein BD01_1304 [Thermococcus nautili]|uniref:Uncharacterized protein n=1 Tax=Thermococcus nautili TaxID=195522 RepID=W8P5X3_9EURY|nr:hypothetical protein BD01_1304 [Thermococcus nautili]